MGVQAHDAPAPWRVVSDGYWRAYNVFLATQTSDPRHAHYWADILFGPDTRWRSEYAHRYLDTLERRAREEQVRAQTNYDLTDVIFPQIPQKIGGPDPQGIESLMQALQDALFGALEDERRAAEAQARAAQQAVAKPPAKPPAPPEEEGLWGLPRMKTDEDFFREAKRHCTLYQPWIVGKMRWIGFNLVAAFRKNEAA